MKLRITDTEIIIIKGEGKEKDKRIVKETSYMVDCPFEKSDIVKGGLEEFKYRILKLFKMYGEGGVMTAQYDFEQEAEFDEGNALDILSGQEPDDRVREAINERVSKALEGNLFNGN